MKFYNEPTTAESFAMILARDVEQRKGQESSVHRTAVVSIPNGKHYGATGHIPCDHYVSFGTLTGELDVVNFTYRTFTGRNWVKGHAAQFSNA